MRSPALEKEQLQQLNTRHKKEVASGEKRIADAKKNIQSQLQSLKQQAYADQIRIREEGELKKLNEIQRGQESLSQASETLSKTQKKLSDEKESLQLAHINNLKKLDDNFTDSMNEKNEILNEKFGDLNQKSSAVVQELQQTYDQQLAQGRNEVNAKLSDLHQNFNTKLTNNKENYIHEFEKNKLDLQDNLTYQRIEHAERANREKLKHGKIENNQKQQNEIEIQEQAKLHQMTLDQLKQSLVQNVESLKKDYERNIETVKKLSDLEINEIKAKTTETKNYYGVRQQDDFYNLKSLEPNISHNENFYKIELEIPEHEKDNVIFSANKRQLRITVTRQFKDQLQETPNQLIKNNRSETLTKEFSLPDIVNSKSINREYIDGKLIFTVYKA